MSILKNRFEKNFSLISKQSIEDTRLSNGAFRLLCYLYSRPNDWVINNKDIQNKLGIKDSCTIAKYWKELETLFYIKRERERYKGKLLNYNIELLEPQCEKTNIEKTHTGEIPSVTNIDISTNNDIYTNNDITILQNQQETNEENEEVKKYDKFLDDFVESFKSFLLKKNNYTTNIRDNIVIRDNIEKFIKQNKNDLELKYKIINNIKYLYDNFNNKYCPIVNNIYDFINKFYNIYNQNKKAVSNNDWSF